jgi:hypothetical protein
MPPRCGIPAWHHDLVSVARPDVVVATGASVALHRFVRLDVPYIDAVVVLRPALSSHRGNAAQATSTATITTASTTM